MTPTLDIGKLAGGIARRAGLPLPARRERLEINGKTALITGAGQGIGLLLAHELHARSANVALLDIDPATLTLACAQIGKERTLALTADVRDRAAMRTAIQETIERFGTLDVVVANAGVAPRLATLRTIDPDEYDRVIAINQTGVFNTIKPAIEPIIQSRGHIVVVASVAALLPGPRRRAVHDQQSRRRATRPHAANRAHTPPRQRRRRVLRDRRHRHDPHHHRPRPDRRTRGTPPPAALAQAHHTATSRQRHRRRDHTPRSTHDRSRDLATHRSITRSGHLLDDTIASDPRTQALLRDIETRA